MRIAAVQYLLRSIDSWEAFENQVRFVMKAAGDYKPQFVMFPEIFTTQLLSFMDTSDLRRAVRNMNDYTERYLALFSDLARQWGCTSSVEAIPPSPTASCSTPPICSHPKASISPRRRSI